MKRRWLLYILIILFIWIIVGQLNEIEKLGSTVIRGQWQWVAIAVVLQATYYLFFAREYQAAFHTVELKSRAVDLLPVIFASMSVHMIAPSGGASSLAVFVDDTSRRGYSPARTAAGLLLAHAGNFVSFWLILVPGMAILLANHQLKTYEIVTALVMILVVLVISGVLLLGFYQPERLHGLLSWINRLPQRIHLRQLISAEWVERSSAEFTEASLAIATHPDRLIETFAFGVAAHLTNLACLYALFLAFHTHIAPGLLLAGFSIGILFTLIAITPQGVGVVEGIMALTYTSLGVPAERATVIALSFRFLTFWIPLIAGFFILPRLRSFRSSLRAPGETSVQIVALLTALMGFINLISAVTPSMPERIRLLHQISPLAIRQGSHLASALAGFALFLLAGGLWRRKRTAWLLTLTVLAVSIASHLLKGLNFEESILAAALFTWLVYLRREFHARSDPPSVRQGLIALVAAFGFTIIYGAVGFYILDRHFKVSFNWVSAIGQTLVMFTQFVDPGLTPLTSFGRFFAGSIYVVAATTLCYALLMLIRPVLVRRPASQDDMLRAKKIVDTYVKSGFVRLALLPDKNYFFSHEGSMIAYSVKGRIALTLGDPVGPVEDLSKAVQEFVHYCSMNDWEPAFTAVLPEYLTIYHQAGLQSVCIGQEAIIDTGKFSLGGHSNKNLRNSYNKILRLGYRAEVFDPPISENLLKILRKISNEWLREKQSKEMHFGTGWFDEDYLRDCPVMVIFDSTGEAIAFANLLLTKQGGEISIDLMRHIADMENGVMDFLFASLILWSKEQGASTFSMGLSALSGVERNEKQIVERGLHYLFEHIDEIYNFKGLFEYKNKFNPIWQPRYLVYSSATSLPAVALALIRVDSGDNWFTLFIKKKY